MEGEEKHKEREEDTEGGRASAERPKQTKRERERKRHFCSSRWSSVRSQGHVTTRTLMASD